MMVDRFDPPRDLDWKPLPMRPDIAGQYARYSDLAKARAEIERLDRAALAHRRATANESPDRRRPEPWPGR